MYKFNEPNIQKLEFSFLHLNSIEPDMPSPIVNLCDCSSHFIDDNSFLNSLNNLNHFDTFDTLALNIDTLSIGLNSLDLNNQHLNNRMLNKDKLDNSKLELF